MDENILIEKPVVSDIRTHWRLLKQPAAARQRPPTGNVTNIKDKDLTDGCVHQVFQQGFFRYD